MKTRKKITIGVIVAFLAVVMVGYIYLFTGAKIKNVSNDVIKGDEETKSLVVYFTRQGVIPGDVDAVSSATQSSNKGMEGSDTEGAARMIQRYRALQGLTCIRYTPLITTEDPLWEQLQLHGLRSCLI